MTMSVSTFYLKTIARTRTIRAREERSARARIVNIFMEIICKTLKKMQCIADMEQSTFYTNNFILSLCYTIIQLIPTVKNNNFLTI